MKKSEKLITALLTIAIGVLLLVLRGELISILMTVVGVALIVLGVMDLISRAIPAAVIKLVCGIAIIVCGWVVVKAVLYVFAVLLIILGILIIYYNIKRRVKGCTPFQTVCKYAVPIICIVIGVLLFFNGGVAVNVIFIVCGILTIIEGGLLLFNALSR